MDKLRIKFSENHVLLDVEGTTTSVAFVKEILFPCIRKNLKQYVEDHWFKEEFQTVLALLKEQCADDISNKVEGLIAIIDGENEKDTVIKNVLWQMDQDRKTTAMKKLQGNVLKNCFRTGELKGHVYDDVVPAVKSWKECGKKIYIYSSGSVEAQKLLFRYSEFGDILDLFSGHFDTEVGPKIETKSYSNIAEIIGCATNDIIFLTDVVREANPALNAGCRVIICERPGNYPISEADRIKFNCISSFQQLSPEN